MVDSIFVTKIKLLLQKVLQFKFRLWALMIQVSYILYLKRKPNIRLKRFKMIDN